MPTNSDDSEGGDTSRKRKANDAPDQPPAKQSRNIICIMAEVHASYAEKDDKSVEDVKKEIRNEDIPSGEGRNIMSPSIDGDDANTESGDELHVSRKRSREEAELGEEERRIKKSAPPSRSPSKNSLARTVPQEPAKPKMLPWAEVKEGGEPTGPQKHPERYWIPDEWPESLAYE